MERITIKIKIVVNLEKEMAMIWDTDHGGSSKVASKISF